MHYASKNSLPANPLFSIRKKDFFFQTSGAAILSPNTLDILQITTWFIMADHFKIALSLCHVDEEVGSLSLYEPTVRIHETEGSFGNLFT